MSAAGLSFITLLAYDYRYAFTAIRSYYAIADEIILGLDRDRLTWSKQPFLIDMDEVARFIREIDVNRKIRIVEGDFHAADHPMANDVAERNALSLQAKAGNWVVQIDCDEVLQNAGEFLAWMETADPQLGVNARWLSIFKIFDDGQALVIDPPSEVTGIATQLRGQYAYARWTRQEYRLSPLLLVHFSWGRTSAELEMKLRNWGHARDFDCEAFLRFWNDLSPQNYQHIRNFHPIEPHLWPQLKLIELKKPRG